MPQCRWLVRAASGAAATVLLVTAAACGTSGSSSPGASATSAAPGSAPLSQAALISGSKHEKGLVIYSNALLSQMQHVDQGVRDEVPVDPRHRDRRRGPGRVLQVRRRARDRHPDGGPPDRQRPRPVGRRGRPSAILSRTPRRDSRTSPASSQGNGLYIFSPDPAITIYNKLLLKGHAPPDTVAQIAQDGIAGKYKVATYTINNNFGYTAF